MSLAAAGMGMNLVGGIMDGLSGLAQTGLGIAQYVKGNKMNPIRPTYSRPDEVNEIEAMRQQAVGSRMPGVTQAMSQIQANQGNMLSMAGRGSSNPGQYMSALAAMQGQTNQSYEGLAVAEGQYRNQAINQLVESKMIGAEYSDKEFMLNKMEPYMDEAQTKAALMQGGLQNMFGGFGQTAGAAKNTGSDLYYMDMMNKQGYPSSGQWADGKRG